MSTVEEIRAALDERDEHIAYVANGGVTYGKVATAQERFEANSERWLRTLLAENERMAAVVEAAREMSRVCDHAPELVPDVYFQWKALRQALAALEGGE